jgi:hypothetical protein
MSLLLYILNNDSIRAVDVDYLFSAKVEVPIPAEA